MAGKPVYRFALRLNSVQAEWLRYLVYRFGMSATDVIRWAINKMGKKLRDIERSGMPFPYDWFKTRPCVCLASSLCFSLRLDIEQLCVVQDISKRINKERSVLIRFALHELYLLECRAEKGGFSYRKDY